jgi:GDP/UDP-N,N'-diacetylbacillosamine 2-epimerase (hydrolysing)
VERHRLKRTICYLTGTRADFGLMRDTLEQIHGHDLLKLQIIVTGMHLDARFGLTKSDIEASGLPVTAVVPVWIDAGSCTGAAHAIATIIDGLADALARLRPDILVLLGDRGEMLAGAIASIHLNIPVVHIHGGERSGTVDEPVRHAITKLSHFHFVATEQSRQRVIQMGECADYAFVVGAPGVSGLATAPRQERATLVRETNLDENRPIALFVFHPVLVDAQSGGDEVRLILDVLAEFDVQIVALLPNGDTGRDDIASALDIASGQRSLRVFKHIERNRFISWMAAVDFMVGNSSAGIIEAASFGLPVVNVGTRQAFRERSGNVVDVPAEADSLRSAVKSVLENGRMAVTNVYAAEDTPQRIADLLTRLPLSRDVLRKINAY